jgi:hypothetical protein
MQAGNFLMETLDAVLKRNPGKIVKAGNGNSLNNAFKQNNINDES